MTVFRVFAPNLTEPELMTAEGIPQLQCDLATKWQLPVDRLVLRLESPSSEGADG